MCLKVGNKIFKLLKWSAKCFIMNYKQKPLKTYFYKEYVNGKEPKSSSSRSLTVAPKNPDKANPMENFQELPESDGQQAAPFSPPHLLTPLDSVGCQLHLPTGIAFAAANEVSQSKVVSLGSLAAASTLCPQSCPLVLSRNLPWTWTWPLLVLCRLAA